MNYANTMAVRYTDWRIKLNPVIGWAVLLSLVLLPVALWSDAPYVLNILAYTYLFAGLASAWNLIGGIGGQFSLGHGAFFGTGAYMVAGLFLKQDVSPWIALLPAAAVAALAGF